MKKTSIILVFLVLLLVAIALDLCIGSYHVSLSDFINFVLGHGTQDVSLILFDIRLPRVLTAVLAGATLSMSGAVMQSVFNNDLVSPDILGVSSGAACGASIGIVLGFSSFFISTFAFLGGLLAVFLTLGIAIIVCRNIQSSLLIMVLAGIVVSAFFSGIVELSCTFNTNTSHVMSILFFLFGSFSKVTMSDLTWIITIFVISSVILWLMSYALDVLSLGEEEARCQGVPVFIVRNTAIMLATLMCASLIAKTGIIGWIGLVVPHAARFIIGTSHRLLIPTSALLGAITLVIIDVISRTLFSYEIPVGIITSIIGAPVFVLILSRSIRSKKDA